MITVNSSGAQIHDLSRPIDTEELRFYRCLTFPQIQPMWLAHLRISQLVSRSQWYFDVKPAIGEVSILFAAFIQHQLSIP